MNAALDAVYFAERISLFFSRSAFCCGVSFGAFFAALRKLSSIRCPSLFVCLGMILMCFGLFLLVAAFHHIIVKHFNFMVGCAPQGPLHRGLRPP